MNISFSYINDADAATLTSSSADPSFPAANVQQRWHVKPWRSTGDAAEYLRFAMVGTPQLDIVIIKNHNLTAAATVQVNYYSDAYITLVHTDTMTVSAGLMAMLIDQDQPYFEITFADGANPDGYIEIGRVLAGEIFRPRIGFSMERAKVPQDPSVISESENGQPASIQRTKFRTWDYTFEGVDPDDSDDMDDIFDEVGLSKALFIGENPDEADITPYIKYIQFTSWEYEHIAGEWWKLMVEIKEER
jgi:hypothetical protein